MQLIDISKWNGSIDFARVKKQVDGVIIRTGFGVKHPNQKDRRFEEYYAGCKSVGLPVGAYHYSYAKDVAGVLKEADFMLEIMQGKSFELPIFGDFEEQEHLSNTQCTETVKAFCNHLENHGAWAGIYSYDSFFKKLPAHIGERYTLWVARVEYAKPRCVPPNEYGIWQYSWKGHVDGINGDVDMDTCYKNYPTIMKQVGLNRF